MSSKQWLMGALAYGLLMSGGCLNTGCSQASRTKWQSSADHTGQALHHTGGAIADGAEAVVLDVAWIAEQFQGLWGGIPFIGKLPLLGAPLSVDG